MLIIEKVSNPEKETSPIDQGPEAITKACVKWPTPVLYSNWGCQMDR